ncbi:unnamed protein product [Prunus brigantina]
MSRQYTLNINLFVCSFSGCGMRFANKHEKTGHLWIGQMKLFKVRKWYPLFTLLDTKVFL